MRNIFSIGLLAILLSLVSCNKENMGFPSSVNFSKNGGSMIIKGEEMPYIFGLEILDYDGDGNFTNRSEESDSIMVSYQWLTAKMRVSDNKVELIAEPSNSSKKRTLYLFVHDGKDMSETKVTQE